MEPLGLPPATGGPAAQPGGPARRLGIILVGVLAIAGVAVAVAILLLGPTSSWPFIAMVAGLLVGFVAGIGRTLFLLRSPGTLGGAGVGAWVTGRGWVAERDSVDDRDLAQEIQHRWREAAEGAGLGRLVTAPGGFWIRVPVVMRVQLRPFTRLTVQLWAGQLVSDVVAVEDRLRDLMRARGIHIEHLAPDYISVELWGGAYGPRLSISDLRPSG
jgi:hypothetical protein